MHAEAAKFALEIKVSMASDHYQPDPMNVRIISWILFSMYGKSKI